MRPLTPASTMRSTPWAGTRSRATGQVSAHGHGLASGLAAEVSRPGALHQLLSELRLDVDPGAVPELPHADSGEQGDRDDRNVRRVMPFACARRRRGERGREKERGEPERHVDRGLRGALAQTEDGGVVPAVRKIRLERVTVKCFVLPDGPA